MPRLSIGKGFFEAEDGKSIQSVITALREDSARAKELEVSAALQDVVAAVYNGQICDLSTPVTTEGTVEFVASGSPEGLNIIRHTASHIMAQAVLRLYPGSKFGVGPTIKDGFYYDIESSSPIGDADLEKIEAEMEKIVGENLRIVRSEMPSAEAVEFFKSAGQPYKVELIEDLKAEKVSLYKQGEFTDLCRGPHLSYTRNLKAFKLQNISGAYWRGSEKNAMLTRIYGTAFNNKDALKNHLNRLEEAKKRDHRVLGKKLDLFHLEEDNPGQIYWHPHGWSIYVTLQNYMRKKQREHGYVEVHTPSVMAKTLWEQSGHWAKYKENMFVTESEKREFAIKPMNCPGHIQIFKQGLKSYRDLPLRIAEFGSCCRNEVSGALHGIMRVRGFVQDDAHIFCMESQIESEVADFCKFLREVYADFGFHDGRIKVKLSTRPELRLGSDETWDRAEEALGSACKSAGFDYVIQPGEGAFYGPKLEFTLVDALERDWQCGTIQLDYQLPSAERLNAEYVGEDGQKHNCVMLHRAILGSLERFIGILIEHFGGKFPVWLAPVQVAILPVSEKFNDYAGLVEKELRAANFRVSSDLSSEKLGYKIRQAQMEQLPYMVVIGEKEVENGTVAVRHRELGDLGAMPISGLISRLMKEAAEMK